jgi:hypothetical protein
LQKQAAVRIVDTMQEIPLIGEQGELLFLLVDDEDYEFMSRFPWKAYKDGDSYYARTTVSAHRLLVDYRLVDHVNGNSLDNTRVNLRSSTPQQNSWNRGLRSDSLTGYKGVSSRRGGKGFIARIQVEGKRKFLGWFHNPVDAARAYDAAAREYFGEFARLNFPDEGGDA